MNDSNRVRQFFKREGVRFEDINDILTAQHIFYLPYFTDTPFKVDQHGVPLDFPTVTNENGEIIVQKEFDELNFSIPVS